MKITENHLLDVAKKEIIPGGAEMAIRRCLVIHFTAGASAMSSINWWRKLNNGVCAHFVIDRDGTIYQCRPCNKTAGHAGASKWTDPKTGLTYFGINSCSIGIELANGGDAYPEKFSNLNPLVARHKNGGPARKWERYPDAQIDSCNKLALALVKKYNLDDIVGHDDVAPLRKTDPGPAFNMLNLKGFCGFSKKD